MVLVVEVLIDGRLWEKGLQEGGILGPEPRNKILSPSSSGDIKDQ